MKMIGIVGLGWLGTPLANNWALKGYKVWGTTRDANRERFQTLSDQVEVLEWPDGDPQLLEEKLSITDILYLTLPPSAFEGKSVSVVKNLLEKVQENGMVVYTSSIGVYASKEGEINENSPLNEDHKVVQTEQVLAASKVKKKAIVRLGGLIGGNRHPVHFLNQKININPDSWVQLIGRNDCVKVLSQLGNIEENSLIMNLVHPDLISRKEYYTKVAQHLQVKEPEFSDEQTDINPRKVKSNNFATLFPDYQFESLYCFK